MKEEQTQGSGSIFDMLFNRGGGQQTRQKRKADPILHTMSCTLDDLYNGKTQKIRITRQVCCTQCGGTGSTKPVAKTVCEGCNGQGVRTVMRRLGPGIIQQGRETCPECRGKGKVIDKKDECPNCRGEGEISDKKILEVFVDPGTPNGRRITFEGEGDQGPSVLPGDVVVQIEEIPHHQFVRKGNDLHVNKTITLGEALCGFEFHLPTLSSEPRILHIKSEAGDIIQPNQTRIIPEQGMPLFRDSIAKGNLIIHFNITYPDKGTLTPAQLRLLSVIFRAPPQIQERPEHEVAILVEGGPSTGTGRGSSYSSGDSKAYEDDDDEGGYTTGAPQVGCVQQ